MADATKGRQRSPLPAKRPAVLTPGDRAAAEALAPLSFGEAPQIGLLGDPGTGKTTAALKVSDSYLRASPGCVLVADTKGEGRFKGQRYKDVAELERRKPAPEPRVLTFRGDPFAGADLDPEEIARLQWQLAARGVPSLGVYDELSDATSWGQWKAGKNSTLRRNFGQGRARGIADLWGTQSPQDAPLEPFNQSNCILCFRLAGHGLRKLGELDYLAGGADKVIPTLPGMESPPAERGTFVLLRRGRPWDGRLYRF